MLTEQPVTYFTDWVEYFDSLASSEEVNKGSLKKVLSAYNHSANADNCETNLERDDETVFIAKMGIGGRLKMFHHYKSNNTTHSKSGKATILLGMGKSNNHVFNLDTEMLLKKPTVDTPMPTPTNLLGISTAETAAALATGSSNLKARNFSPVPPFLVNPLASAIKANDGSVIHVLMTAISSIHNFDTVNADDDEFVEKAKDECLQFVQWLYAANLTPSPIANIVTQMCEDQSILRKYKGITEIVEGNQSQVTQQNPSSSDQNNVIEALTISQIATKELIQNMMSTNQAKEKANKSIFKLAPKFTRMLQVAGSMLGEEAVPEKIADEGMEFFASTNEKTAIIYLNTLLEQKNLRVQVPPAVVNQIYHGALRWESPSKPSGLAACCLEFIEIERRDILTQGLVIDLKSRFEMTPEIVETLTKSHVLLPTRVDDLIERLRAITEIASMLWGEDTRIPQKLVPFVNWLDSNKLTVTSREASHPEYIAKVMIACDNRINLWLTSCVNAKHAGDTWDFHLDFMDIAKTIMHNEFHYALPSGIQQLNKEEDSKDTDEDGKSKKRKRLDVEYVNNPQMVTAWRMRPQENYDSTFANKVLEAPMLSIGCKGCHRWHNRGRCFKGCANEASHKKLSGKDYTTFNAFVKKCRGES